MTPKNQEFFYYFASFCFVPLIAMLLVVVFILTVKAEKMAGTAFALAAMFLSALVGFYIWFLILETTFSAVGDRSGYGKHWMIIGGFTTFVMAFWYFAAVRKRRREKLLQAEFLIEEFIPAGEGSAYGISVKFFNFPYKYDTRKNKKYLYDDSGYFLAEYLSFQFDEYSNIKRLKDTSSIEFKIKSDGVPEYSMEISLDDSFEQDDVLKDALMEYLPDAIIDFYRKNGLKN